jgi:DnaJ like chaperone protein
MAIKHHPDKVANMGEDIENAAKAKFQSINQAWER